MIHVQLVQLYFVVVLTVLPAAGLGLHALETHVLLVSPYPGESDGMQD